MEKLQQQLQENIAEMKIAIRDAEHEMTFANPTRKKYLTGRLEGLRQGYYHLVKLDNDLTFKGE